MKSISKKSKSKEVDPSKPKKEFKMNYKQYDHVKEGYGNPEQWQQAFNKRFTQEEAQNILKAQPNSPQAILGIKIGESKEAIKKAYFILIKKWHPDKNPDNIKEAEEMSKKIIAAYTVLTK